MNNALFLHVLDVVGFATTAVLPIAGFLLWLKLAFLVSGPGGLHTRMTARLKWLLLLILMSPLLFGWAIAQVISNG